PQECGQYGERSAGSGGYILDRRHDLARNRTMGGTVAAKCQRKRRSRQGCGGNAKGSAAVAKVAAEMPKEAPQSPRLRRKCQRRRRSRQGCGEMPKEAAWSPRLRRKCQMRCRSRQCCALNAK